MIILQAPHPMYQTTSILPNPSLDDSENIESTLIRKRAMDGSLYTHVKTNDRRKLQYDFILKRPKALEVDSFVLAYFPYPIRLINWKDEIWVVHIMSDPNEFSAVARGEINNVRLEFEGVKIDG